MPTYQYACTACGHELEAFQSFSDDALTECPECNGRLRKRFGAVGVVFKGSGFYRTDSRGKVPSESSSSSSTTSTTTSSDSSSSSSTPAPATTTTKSSDSGSSSSGSSSKPAAAGAAK